MITIFRLGVSCEDGGVIVGAVFNENKLHFEIFNEKKSLLKNVFLSQFKLRIQLLLKDGIRIKNKKVCRLWGFTEKSDFVGSFIKINDKQGEFSKKGGLVQLGDLRWGWEKNGWCF